ncbi:unnamed protein product, partial [Cylicocyclus nassatus]
KICDIKEIKLCLKLQTSETSQPVKKSPLLSTNMNLFSICFLLFFISLASGKIDLPFKPIPCRKTEGLKYCRAWCRLWDRPHAQCITTSDGTLKNACVCMGYNGQL